jgi:very-short-patch-repair endonuclease
VRGKLRQFRLTTARRLRADATDAERRLWRELRRFALQGTHFRRQVPIGPYVVDFGCLHAKLLIEIDGSQHGFKKNIHKDEARTRWLNAEGYRVLRFWNNDISRNMKGVMEAIYAELYGSMDAEPKPFTRRRFPRNVVHR